jgi:hypothetical protein
MDAQLLDGQSVVRTADVAGWLDSLGFDDLGTLIRDLEVTPSVPAGCTGYLDEEHHGHLAHDGMTCPVHECPTIVRLSGADCIGVVLRSSLIEVRQYHADHLDAPAEGDPYDEYGRYEVIEAASGTAPVTAGSSPGLAAEHRGVRAWATIENHEDPDHHDLVTVRFYLEPVPRGLENVYTYVRVPEEHRGV